MRMLIVALVSTFFVTPDQLKWSAYAEKGWPAGSSTAVVAGDPTKPCGWVLRFRMPDGYQVPAHANSDVESTTVLAGTYIQGLGGNPDRARASEYPVGSYIQVGRGVPHYGYAVGITILEIRPICR